MAGGTWLSLAPYCVKGALRSVTAPHHSEGGQGIREQALATWAHGH